MFTRGRPGPGATSRPSRRSPFHSCRCSRSVGGSNGSPCPRSLCGRIVDFMGTQIGVEAVLASAMISLAGCGVEGIGETEDAIIGGTLVDPGDYPATGALLHGGHFHCTATLIAPGVAITAAHCLENSGFGGGFSFTLTADVSSSAQHPKEILRVHVVHQHPNYNPSGAFARLGEVNDIGLVLLESPVTSIPLETLDGPTRAYMPPGSDLVTAGYGLLSYYATSTA